MGTMVVLLIFAALVGGVVWNHRNKSAALSGVEFQLPEPPPAVAAAISALYCQGAKAKVRGALTKVSVSPMGAGGFVFGTKMGDHGEIEVHPGTAGGSVVRASTSSLHIGGGRRPSDGEGMFAAATAISHLICVVLRIGPYAANMKRFQRGLEGRISRQVGRQLSS
jgi:hypothetical protein